MRVTLVHALLLGAFIGVRSRASAVPCRDGQCSERDIVPRIVIEPEIVPPKIEGPVVVPKPAGPDFVPGGPKPPGDKTPTVPGQTKPDVPPSKKGPTKLCRKRSDDGECSDYSSLGSFNNVRYVGMGRTKTSQTGDDPVAATGVNGCTAIFFHGQTFVTATHADAEAVAAQAGQGATEAAGYGTVHTITIRAPDDANFQLASNVVGQRFPGARIVKSNYQESTLEGAFWTFSASPGDTTITSQLDHH